MFNRKYERDKNISELWTIKKKKKKKTLRLIKILFFLKKSLETLDELQDP